MGLRRYFRGDDPILSIVNGGKDELPYINQMSYWLDWMVIVTVVRLCLRWGVWFFLVVASGLWCVGHLPDCVMCSMSVMFITGDHAMWQVLCWSWCSAVLSCLRWMLCKAMWMPVADRCRFLLCSVSTVFVTHERFLSFSSWFTFIQWLLIKLSVTMLQWR